MNCAPGKKFEEGSCFTRDDLQKILNIVTNGETNNSKTKKQLLEIVNTLMQKDKYKCKDMDQVCWIETTKKIKDNSDEEIQDLVQNTFRPIGPSGKKQWLSTSDIDQSMFQYESKYDDFSFLGAVPYDFDILPQLTIQNLDFNNLIKTNKTKIGVIINLDTHDQNGSHWVALYSDLNKNQIYYFDSFAVKPGKRITLFIQKILHFMYNKKHKQQLKLTEFLNKIIKKKEYTLQSMSEFDDFDVQYNKKRHQFKNSECGVYSMNFIIRLLNGETFEQVQDDIMKDDEMNSCRKVYFRK